MHMHKMAVGDDFRESSRKLSRRLIAVLMGHCPLGHDTRHTHTHIYLCIHTKLDIKYNNKNEPVLPSSSADNKQRGPSLLLSVSSRVSVANICLPLGGDEDSYHFY